MNIWGIHMGEHVASNPIDGEYVGIGWPKIGDLAQLGASRDSFKEGLSTAYPNSKLGAIPVQAGVLYRFVHELEPGDLIVYPSKNDRTVNIGRCVSEYRFEEGDSDGYPNQRSVEWMAHVPRDEFTQAALNEIGSAVTLFSVKRYAHEFLERAGVTNGHETPENISETEDDSVVTGEVSRKAVETTSDFIIRILKNQLDPYEFEHFTAHMLECMGYSARVTDKSGDGGVDVIAHKDELGFEPPIIKVQCKQITSQSGEPDVSKLLGTLTEGEYALFINLGSYSKPARVLERNRSKLRLIDGEEFVNLVLEHYGRLAPRYRTLVPLKQIYVPDMA